MAISFSEQHAMSLVAPHLAQGERVVSRARGVEKPWYSRLLSSLGSFLWRNYLIVATDQRVLFIQHAGLLGGYATKKVDALGWHEVDRAQLGWGIFNKDLTVRAPARDFSKTVVLGRFWMKDNFAGAEAAVAAWGQARNSLPGSTLRSLPPQGAYQAG
jgi:hypothetical protein